MERMPFLYRMIRGAVGKEFVIKHYRGGRIVRTRFPDMSGIVATEKQKVRRNLFREAVLWAKWVIGDEARKLAFKNMLPRKKRKKVYQAVLQMYMREKGNKQWVSKQVLVCNGRLGIEGKDARKQLAELAVVESRRFEFVKGKGAFDRNGAWRVRWQINREMEAGTSMCYTQVSRIILKIPAVL